MTYKNNPMGNISDYGDLTKKTIFDLCCDVNKIQHILPYVPPGYDKEQFYIGYYMNNPELNALAMLELAESLNDEALKIAVEKQFKKELNEYFNE